MRIDLTTILQYPEIKAPTNTQIEIVIPEATDTDKLHQAIREIQKYYEIISYSRPILTIQT